jgi:pimeloyl-ACP methyl ester carboxylesterase
MLLFQFPGIAEHWLTGDNWANFRSWGQHPDADAVITELEATGSLTPGLNWYRANIPPESWTAAPMQLPPVQVPTMGIWSTGDFAFTEIQMTDSVRNITGPWRYEHLDGPGHWMQFDSPDQVNALLLDYLPR